MCESPLATITSRRLNFILATFVAMAAVALAGAAWLFIGR
jgi:hypothetical protein